jgi:hypothetical protein
MPSDARHQPAPRPVLRLLIVATDQQAHHHYVPILTKSPSVLGHAYLVCTALPPTTIPPEVVYPPFDLTLLELPLPNAPALLHYLLNTQPNIGMLALCDGHDGCKQRQTLEARGVRFVRRPALHDTGTALRNMVAALIAARGTTSPVPEAPAD